MFEAYEAIAERRKGPFGLLRSRQSLGKVEQWNTVIFGKGSEDVQLEMHNGTLTITALNERRPLLLHFGPELQDCGHYAKPALDFRLDAENPTTRTSPRSRSRIAIMVEGDKSSRLLLKGDKIDPLILNSPAEVVTFMASVLQTEHERELAVERADGDRRVLEEMRKANRLLIDVMRRSTSLFRLP